MKLKTGFLALLILITAQLFGQATNQNNFGGSSTGAGITSGASLPTSGCTVGQLFNQTQTNPSTSLLWRNLNNSGTGCTWQQIKPTVETIYARDYGVQGTG